MMIKKGSQGGAEQVWLALEVGSVGCWGLWGLLADAGEVRRRYGTVAWEHALKITLEYLYSR